MTLRRAAPVLGALAILAALHTFLVLHTHTAIVMGDELGYLDNARYLARGGVRPANTYFPGLSVLLTPVWWVTTHGRAVWRTAEVVNSAATVVTFFGAAVLGRMCGLSARARWLVALTVTLYPPIMLYSDFSLSESLFQAVFVWLVVAVAAAVRQRDTGRWALVGVLGGAAAIVHPRGFAVLVALALVALPILVRSVRTSMARFGPSVVALGAAVVGSLGVLRVLTVTTRAVNFGGRYDYHPQSLIWRNESWHSLAILGVSTVGRVFYQSVASVGLVPFAAVLGLVALPRLVRGRCSPVDAVRAFTLLSLMGVAALTMLLRGTQPDQLIQGRYLDGVVAPMMVIALAHVSVSRRWREWALIGVAAIVASGALFAATRHFARESEVINRNNILGVEPLVRALGRVDSLVLAAAGVAALFGLVVIVAVTRRLRVAMAVLAVLFVASAVDTQVGFIGPGSAAKASQDELVHVLLASRSLGLRADCVSYDNDHQDFNFFSDRLMLGGRPLTLMLPGQQPCGAFVISTRSPLLFTTSFPGARLVALENYVNDALYVLPGPTADTLGARGWLLPLDTPGPLPSGQRPAITTSPAPVSIRAGGTTTRRVTIRNDASPSPWPAAAGLKQKIYAVRVATRWSASGRVVTAQEVDLPRSLLPGEQTSLDVPLVAPLVPGRYHVQIVVYQERAVDLGPPVILDATVT